jgi:hypothetical protein
MRGYRPQQHPEQENVKEQSSRNSQECNAINHKASGEPGAAGFRLHEDKAEKRYAESGEDAKLQNPFADLNHPIVEEITHDGSNSIHPRAGYCVMQGSLSGKRLLQKD